MRPKRLLITVGLIVAIAALTSVLLVVHWQRASSPLKNLAKLIAAVHRYSEDHFKQGQVSKSSISIQDLVAGGYLSAENAREYKGMDVLFYPNADESLPESILLAARLPDGHKIVAMADGSVQEFDK